MSETTMAFAPPPLAHLRARAAACAAIRQFFTARGHLEVSTPALRGHGAMDPHLCSFVTTLVQPGGAHGVAARRAYLQTSPEYALKILLGTYGCSLFEIAKVFRNEEAGPYHHHEFTMVEWYSVGSDDVALMEETEALVRAVAAALGCACLVRAGRAIALERPFIRLSVREAFVRYAGVDPFVVTDRQDFIAAARSVGSAPGDDWPWEDVFHLLLMDKVEGALGWEAPTFLHDYPPSLSALARFKADAQGCRVAARFELYVGGLELCNGYDELNDPDEQRERFAREQALRAALGREAMPVDEALLWAVGRMPPTAGNALGLERLLMVLLGADDIGAVLVR